jgi:hypothetical protein
MTARRQDALNRMNPASAKAKVGDVLSDLLTYHNALAARMACVLHGSTGLAINGAGNTAVKTSAAAAAMAAGVPIIIAANTVLPALAGVIATTKFAAWAFYVDATGAMTVSAKTADAATAAAAAALAAFSILDAMIE